MSAGEGVAEPDVADVEPEPAALCPAGQHRRSPRIREDVQKSGESRRRRTFTPPATLPEGRAQPRSSDHAPDNRKHRRVRREESELAAGLGQLELLGPAPRQQPRPHFIRASSMPAEEEPKVRAQQRHAGLKRRAARARAANGSKSTSQIHAHIATVPLIRR